MVRITSSDIAPQSGGSTRATAFKQSDALGSALSNLGEVGMKMATEMQKKKDDAEYIKFKGEYNRTMTEMEVGIKNEMLRMDSDGNLKDEFGNTTGGHINDRLDEMDAYRQESMGKAEGVAHRNKAVDYMSNIRAQDDLKTRLTVEKALAKKKKTETISEIGDVSTLFTNAVMQGDFSASRFAELNATLDESKGVIGDDAYTELKNKVSTNISSAYMQSVKTNGRNPATEKALMSMGGMSKGEKERMQIMADRAHKTYVKREGEVVAKIGEKAIAVSTNAQTFVKSGQKAIQQVSRMLDFRKHESEDYNNEQAFSVAAQAVGSSALMKDLIGVNNGDLGGASKPLQDADGVRTPYGNSAIRSIASIADQYIKDGSLAPSEREEFIQTAFDKANAQRNRTIADLQDPSKVAGYAVKHDPAVAEALKKGDAISYRDGVKSYIEDNGLSKYHANYWTGELEEHYRKRFKDATPQEVAKETMGLAHQYGDEFPQFINGAISSGQFPEFTSYSGMMSPEMTQIVSDTEATKKNNLAQLQYTGSNDYKRSLLKDKIGNAVNRMGITGTSGGMYRMGAINILENIAVDRMANGGMSDDQAIAHATKVFNKEVVVARSGDSQGIVASRRELEKVGLSEEALKTMAGSPKKSVELFRAKGARINTDAMLNLIGSNPALQESMAKFRSALNIEGGDDAVQDSLYTMFQDDFVMIPTPGKSSSMTLAIRTDAGEIPVVFNDGTGDVDYKEVNNGLRIDNQINSAPVSDFFKNVVGPDPKELRRQKMELQYQLENIPDEYRSEELTNSLKSEIASLDKKASVGMAQRYFSAANRAFSIEGKVPLGLDGKPIKPLGNAKEGKKFSNAITIEGMEDQGLASNIDPALGFGTGGGEDLASVNEFLQTPIEPRGLTKAALTPTGLEKNTHLINALREYNKFKKYDDRVEWKDFKKMTPEEQKKLIEGM